MDHLISCSPVILVTILSVSFLQFLVLFVTFILYSQGWESLLEAMKKARRLNNHVFSMLKARCPLEDKVACAIKQSGAPLHRIKFENTISAFETLPQKGTWTTRQTDSCNIHCRFLFAILVMLIAWECYSLQRVGRLFWVLGGWVSCCCLSINVYYSL